MSIFRPAVGNRATQVVRSAYVNAVVLMCAAAMTGCGPNPESIPAPATPAADAAIVQETPAPAKPERRSASEIIAEREAELNRVRREREETPRAAAPAIVWEEDKGTSIPFVPTRPIYLDDPADFVDEEETEIEEDGEEDSEPPEPRRQRKGRVIEQSLVDQINDHMGVYIIQDLMPVQGVRIDAYSKYPLTYEVWEWRSEGESEIRAVRIHFIDGRMSMMAVNPGEYIFAR